MSEKNICQNPTCCDKTTDDRWNKKINKFQSRKAYSKPRLIQLSENKYRSVILEYFCTTSCAFTYLRDNLENIIERKEVPNKILDKIIRA